MFLSTVFIKSFPNNPQEALIEILGKEGERISL